MIRRCPAPGTGAAAGAAGFAGGFLVALGLGPARCDGVGRALPDGAAVVAGLAAAGVAAGVSAPAVLSGAPGNYVYLVNADDSVSVRKVTLGPSDGNNTAILTGLAVGDTVVIDGTDRLSDNAKISVAAPNATSGTAPAAPGAQPAKKTGKPSASPAPGAGVRTSG